MSTLWPQYPLRLDTQAASSRGVIALGVPCLDARPRLPALLSKVLGASSEKPHFCPPRTSAGAALISGEEASGTSAAGSSPALAWEDRALPLTRSLSLLPHVPPLHLCSQYPSPSEPTGVTSQRSRFFPSPPAHPHHALKYQGLSAPNALGLCSRFLGATHTLARLREGGAAAMTFLLDRPPHAHGTMSCSQEAQSQAQACLLSHLESIYPSACQGSRPCHRCPGPSLSVMGSPFHPLLSNTAIRSSMNQMGQTCVLLQTVCIGGKKNDSCTWPSRPMRPVLCPPASWPAFACLCRSCPYLRAQHSSENPSGPPLRSNWGPHSPTPIPAWGGDKTGFLGPGGDQKGQWGRNPEPSPEDQDPSQRGASGERDPGVLSLTFMCVSIWKRDLGGSDPSSGPGPR